MTTELPHQTHQCPRCELRFAWRTEVEDHFAAEHPAPAEHHRRRVPHLTDVHDRPTS